MTVPEPDELPDWLRPIAEALNTLRADQLSPRFPHPPAGAREAGVLMLFAEGHEGPELVLTRRTATLRSHAGQISFPGGRRDESDADVVAAALRESDEEIGVGRSEVTVLGTLPPLWLPPSNHSVTTVLGLWDKPRIIVPRSRAEVAEILRPPIETLLDPDRRFSVEHPSGWIGPAFDVGGRIPLWGFTAGIISRLFEAVGWERPWDQKLIRPLPGEFL